MKGRTKDEKFIACAYEMALELGDFATPINRYDVGQKVGINPKSVDAICRLLVQANFIKSIEANQIYLTEHGKKLAESIE